MDSRVRYEALPTDDGDDGPVEQVGASVAIAEVPTSAVPEANVHAASATVSQTNETVAEQENNNDHSDDGSSVPLIPQPPPYNIAVDLPTYEQAEQTKQEEAERAEQRAREERSANTFFNRLMSGAQEGDSQLGTDGMFLCTFLMAFIFNWIGLLTSLCVTQTVAGRLGAMSGFGLSLVKWVAIVKHSNWAGEVATGDSLLWWLLILLGFLIFFRGSTQYIRIKYHWHRLNQNTRNNIFYYF